MGITQIPNTDERYCLTLLENTMVIEVMKLAGVESHSVWKAVSRILDDDRVQVHVKPLSRTCFRKRVTYCVSS